MSTGQNRPSSDVPHMVSSECEELLSSKCLVFHCHGQRVPYDPRLNTVYCPDHTQKWHADQRYWQGE
jgi:hypothetical protein